MASSTWCESSVLTGSCVDMVMKLTLSLVRRILMVKLRHFDLIYAPLSTMRHSLDAVHVACVEPIYIYTSDLEMPLCRLLPLDFTSKLDT